MARRQQRTVITEWHHHIFANRSEDLGCQQHNLRPDRLLKNPNFYAEISFKYAHVDPKPDFYDDARYKLQRHVQITTSQSWDKLR